MKENIIKLLDDGLTYSQIVEKLGCSKATISYHAKRIGVSKNTICHYDWENIKAFYDTGHTMTECKIKFGFSTGAWSEAVRSKKIETRPKFPLEKVAIENSKYNRRSIKKRLIDEGILENKCYVCDCKPLWLGKQLVFVLDHINGIHNDHRIENLRLLCPNCNSQTDTFSGKNKKYKSQSGMV